MSTAVLGLRACGRHEVTVSRSGALCHDLCRLSWKCQRLETYVSVPFLCLRGLAGEPVSVRTAWGDGDGDAFYL